jgi:hypothetical protein
MEQSNIGPERLTIALFSTMNTSWQPEIRITAAPASRTKRGRNVDQRTVRRNTKGGEHALRLQFLDSLTHTSAISHV